MVNLQVLALACTCIFILPDAVENNFPDPAPPKSPQGDLKSEMKMADYAFKVPLRGM
jgi:hypothetical protein